MTGNAHAIRYSVFKPLDPKAKALACVIVNFGDQEESVGVSIEGKAGHQAEVNVPFHADHTTTLPARLTLPAHQAAVVAVDE